MILAFTLSMPGVNSWNGKWTGADRTHVVTRTTRSQEVADRAIGYHTYRWDDGWCAGITCKVVTASEAAKLRRRSQGFCGYGWMVDNIMAHGSAYPLDKEESCSQ